MPLQRGEVLGYDFNRMVVDFTMLNQGKMVKCAGEFSLGAPARGLSGASRYSGLNRGKERQRDSE